MREERSEEVIVDLGENLSNSADYAKKLFSEAARLIILIVLNIIPIVNWIVLGYEAKVLKESPGTGAPPKLEKYGELFVEGVKVFLASLIYMLIPTVLIVLGGVSTFGGMMSLQGQAMGAGVMLGGTGVALLALGILLAIPLLILLAVGLAHMIKTGKFGKAFAFGEIFGIIRGIGWGKYLGWIVVVIVITAVIGALAGAIPFVGWIISAVIQPILGVFVFRSMGLLYNDGALAGLKAQAPVMTGLSCASCGAKLQPNHKFCPSCGAAAPVLPASPPVDSPSKFCISCGAKIPAFANFCGSCGAKQT